LLYGIKFSNPAMNKVNESMRKLFVYENNCWLDVIYYSIII
jgi:hypothetical protein